jgi:two-component system, OmpR family, sensor histidine kinase VicK
MQMALHAARMMAWALDLTSQQLTVSANSEESVGARWMSLSDLFSSMSPTDIPKVKELFQFAHAQEQSFRTELRVRGASSDSEVWLEVRGQPLRDSAGVIGRLIGVAADVSEQKRAMLAAAQPAAIVESSQDANVSQTLDGIVISWNEAATQPAEFRSVRSS